MTKNSATTCVPISFAVFVVVTLIVTCCCRHLLCSAEKSAFRCQQHRLVVCWDLTAAGQCECSGNRELLSRLIGFLPHHCCSLEGFLGPWLPIAFLHRANRAKNPNAHATGAMYWKMTSAAGGPWSRQRHGLGRLQQQWNTRLWAQQEGQE